MIRTSLSSKIALIISTGLHLAVIGLFSMTGRSVVEVQKAVSAIELSLVQETPVPKRQRAYRLMQVSDSLGMLPPEPEKVTRPVKEIKYNPMVGAITDAEPMEHMNLPPIYPLGARLLCVEGKVILSAEVLASGRTGEVRVLESSGHDSLDRSALHAIGSWHFRPARRMGQAMASTLKIPVIFSITNEK